MTVPPPLPRDRDPGDAWVAGADGTRYWGRFGAAGLLAHDPARGVLLQHRASWSHHGDTWGIPGGARHRGEPALAGALRESAEEAGVPADAVAPVAAHVLDRAVWSYTTVVARVTRPFEPIAGDAESHELAWVPLVEVANLPLHPGFAASWHTLRAALDFRPSLVIDAANVIGSVPDGWWRDRAGAAERLVASLEPLAHGGIPADALGLPLARWFPELCVVLEGASRGAAPRDRITVVDAPGHGDDAIVAETRRRVDSGEKVTVVTSDRGLRERVASLAPAHGAGWLRRLLADA